MYHGKTAYGRGWHGDPWDSLYGERKRGKKGERQRTDGFAKFGVLSAVPGVDRVKAVERGDLRAGQHANEIEARVGDGASAIRKADERKHSPRRPHFGVVRAGGFHLRQRKNAIADGARTNQQAAVHFEAKRNNSLLSIRRINIEADLQVAIRQYLASRRGQTEAPVPRFHE